MKVTEKFLDVLIAWLSRNGIDDLGMGIDNESCFNMMEQQIVLGVMDIHEVEEWTEEYWRTLGMNWSNLHPMVLRFLHELGHYWTLTSFSPEELMLYNLSKPVVDLDAADAKEKMIEYWKMPDEDAANRWAINFVNDPNNKYQVLELHDIFTIFWTDVTEEVCTPQGE